MRPSHFTSHEVEPGIQVRSSIGVLLYAYVMRHAFSQEGKARAIYIMQDTEEINLSVSAFNHHGRKLTDYLNISFTTHSNY